MALLTPNDRVNNPKSAASCLRCSDLLLSPKRLVAQMTVDRWTDTTIIIIILYYNNYYYFRSVHHYMSWHYWH